MSFQTNFPRSPFISKARSQIINSVAQLRSSYMFKMSDVLCLVTWSHILHLLVTRNPSTGVSTHTKYHPFQNFAHKAALVNVVVHLAMYFVHWHTFHGVNGEEWRLVMLCYFIGMGLLIFFGSLVLYWREGETAALMKINCRVELLCQREGAVNYAELVVVLVCLTAYIAAIGVPIAMFLLSLWKPCMPQTIPSIFLTQCVNWEYEGATVTPLARIIILIAAVTSGYLWWCKPSAVIIALILPAHSAILSRVYFNVISKNLSTNTDRILMKYRNIQIQLNLLNDVMRFPLMTIVMIGVIDAEIIALYMVMSSSANIPFLATLFFGFLGFEMIIIIHIVFHMLRLPCVESENFREITRGALRSPWAKKFFLSLKPVVVSSGIGVAIRRIGSDYEAFGLIRVGLSRCSDQSDSDQTLNPIRLGLIRRISDRIGFCRIGLPLLVRQRNHN
ncbi:hypothetical protein Fcan01_27871 [Folsomia candida]|uniref:Uncharacterized protein n=1 Tax=Folsomia candida TaxID=158441 RepID=A0A226CX96_FOLCA|nr:hypothetical protein Fcan01_27871 [Folsomia candida]